MIVHAHIEQINQLTRKSCSKIFAALLTEGRQILGYKCLTIQPTNYWHQEEFDFLNFLGTATKLELSMSEAGFRGETWSILNSITL